MRLSEGCVSDYAAVDLLTLTGFYLAVAAHLCIRISLWTVAVLTKLLTHFEAARGLRCQGFWVLLGV